MKNGFMNSSLNFAANGTDIWGSAPSQTTKGSSSSH